MKDHSYNKNNNWYLWKWSNANDDLCYGGFQSDYDLWKYYETTVCTCSPGSALGAIKFNDNFIIFNLIFDFFPIVEISKRMVTSYNGVGSIMV